MMEERLCGRCGKIWEPVIHPPSGRRLCKCWILTREQLQKPAVQTKQKTMFELSKEMEGRYGKNYR
jgi:hypothetical protein